MYLHGTQQSKSRCLYSFRVMDFSMIPAKQNFNSSVFIENESERGRALHKILKG